MAVSAANEFTTRAHVTDPADSAAFEVVRDICRRNARSFYFASHFLTRPKRDAAYAVYAFCRMIDDAIDQDDASIETAHGLRHHPAVVSPRQFASRPAPPAPGACATCGPTGPLDNRLALFRDRLDEIYSEGLELPAPSARSEAQHALHAFALTVRRYEIPRQYFLDLAEGCRMDLTVKRYATWKSLEKYCYHVAGVVGLVMSCVFGLTHSDAGRQAVTMGNAMQLTNILRDVKEDWDRGRVYLPLEDMAAFRYGERDLASGTVNDNFRALMRFEIDRARRMYREAADGLCWLAGDGSRLTAASMAVIYAGILNAIERQGYDVFRQRARLTTPQKFRRIPAAWRLARRQAGERLPDVFK